MAEYYPLLARAVSGLPNATAETRRAMYERARGALVKQLRSIAPPVADIENETRALEDAIARIEGELAEKAQAAARIEVTEIPLPQPAPPLRATSPSPQPPAPLPPAATEPAPEASLPAASAPVEPPPARKPLFAPVVPRQAPAIPPVRPGIEPKAGPGLNIRPSSTVWKDLPTGKAPAVVAQGAAQPAEHAAAPMIQPGTGDPSAATKAPDIIVEPTPPATEAAPVVASEAVAGLDPEAVPAVISTSAKPFGLWKKFARPRVDEPAPSAIPDIEQLSADAGAEAAALEASESAEDAASVVDDARPAKARKVRGEAVRPLAPQGNLGRRRNLLYWGAGFALAAAVIGVAILAFVLRDRPEEIARAKAPIPVAPEVEPQAGKIVDRIGAGRAPGAQSRPAGQPQTPVGNPPIPVAQRAALLIQAPTANDPQAISTYVGTVVWRTDTLSRGQGQQSALAVRADVELPEAKMKISLVLQKNTDEALSASHTIELRYTQVAGSPVPSVDQIDTPQMRKEDTPTGDALSGVPTTITKNYFLVGLARGDLAINRNTELLKSRNWIDIPMLLSSGKVAKLTLEKGASGDRALNDAFLAWQK